MPFPYKNPISPIQVLGPQSVNRTVVFGTHFSTNGTGGFMEVFSLSGLTYEIPVGQTGSIEYSGNTIPINFIKGNGAVYSPDVLILNSDNISSGRRKLGMLAYVYEVDQVYQYDIPNYEQLWTAATASTNCVFINEFGTTVRNNTTQGQAFINAWTASTIEGVNGVVRANARWKKYWGNNLSVTGGSYNGVTNTLTLVNITGGTVDITGFGGGGGGGASFTGGNYVQSSLNLNLTSTAGTLTVTGVTGLYISAGTYSSGTTTLSLSNSTGGTITITGFSQTFSGGSGNCINQLYLNQIYPCSSNIEIQPLSTGRVYFGSLSGASGVTIDFNSETTQKSTRFGVNTNNPSYTFEFRSYDRTNGFFYRDKLGSPFDDWKQISISAATDLVPMYAVFQPDNDGVLGRHGISIGSRGYGVTNNSINRALGKTGDTFIQAYSNTNGLNIINGPGEVGANTEDYIRFYAGQTAENNTPDIHIQGSGTTRGFVGINTINVTNQLHVSAATNPVRFEGLQSSTNTRYLVADTNGVVYFTTGVTSASGEYLPLSGGTVTGGTQFTGGLTANTISATTYFNLPVSGLTSGNGIGLSYSNGNYTISYTGTSSGGTISGDYLPLSGGTLTGGTIFQSGLTANTISATTYFNLPISGLTEGNNISITGANGNFTISFTGTTGGGGAPITGGTFNQNNLNLQLASSSSTVTISGVTGLYISAGTYSSSTTTLLLSNSTGGTITITGFSQTFSGGSGNCINQLYLNEIYPCTSDIKIQPLSAGKVFFGSLSGASGFTTDLVSDTIYTTARLGLNNALPDYTFDFYSRDRKNRFYLSDNITKVNVVSNDPAWRPPELARLLVSPQPYINSSLVGRTVTLYNKSGQSQTRVISLVSLNSPPGSGTTRINFTPGIWTQDYSEESGGYFLLPTSEGIGDGDIKSVVFSGDSNLNSFYSVISPNRFGQENFHGINIGVIGYTITGTALTQFGTSGDSFIQALRDTNGLNIINESSTGFTENYIRFYTGQRYINSNGDLNTPDIHIQGSGNTRGFVGIATTGVTNQLHVSATTHPLRLEGLVSSANTRYLVANSDGVITYTTGTTGSGGGFSAVSINNNFQFNATSSQTINFSGINISITSGISTNTLIFSAATGLVGSGTTNYVAKWTGTTALTDSLIYDDGSIVVVSGTSATVPGSKFSVTGPIAAQGVQLTSKSGSIALVTSNYASWGTGGSQIAIGDGTPLGSSTGAHNIAIGSGTIKNAVTPSGNTAIGKEALNILNNGDYNVAIGYEAAQNLNDTANGIFIGYRAGKFGSQGNNVVIGTEAAPIFSGVNSVAIGPQVFGNKTFGNGNVAIGYRAGYESTGGANVFIGYGAGYYATGDNKLFIHNNLTNPPLIYGEFDNLRLGIATTAVTNTLHVSATTHPLRLEGLVSSANTRFLVANSDGVVTYTTAAFGGGGFSAVSINTIQQFNSSVSQTINFSGINISITSGISVNTLIFSAGTGAPAITGGTFDPTNLELDLTSPQGTVIISGVTGLYISAGTYTSGTTTLSLYNSTGGTISITGFSRTFSGGSGNCINQLYLNEIYPCTSDIKIQPLSAGKVFFGSLSGASGLTVDLVSDTIYTTARLGLNNSLPDYTIDFYSRDRKNRLYLLDNVTNVYNFSNTYVIGSLAQFVISQNYDDIVPSWIGTSITLYNSSGDSVTKTLGNAFFNSPAGFTRLVFNGTWAQDYSLDAGGYFLLSTDEGIGDGGLKNVVFSGDSDTNSSYSVVGPNRFGQESFHGINIGIIGYTVTGAALTQVGTTGDSFIQVFKGTNGLNIINPTGTDTDNYIRFYAGQFFINSNGQLNTPDIHIQGSGNTRGFVGIGTTGVTNQLHVSASTHPVRFQGLVSSANTRYLVANSDGVVTYTTSSPGGGGTGFSAITINNTSQFNSSSSQVLNFSGINITITSAATNTLVFSAGTGGGGGISGSGTTNSVTKWTSATGLGNSQLQDNGSQISILDAPLEYGAKLIVNTSQFAGIYGRATQYGIYGEVSGLTSFAAGVYGEATKGQYGVYGNNMGDAAGTYIGVFGNAAQGDSGFSGTTYIGGKFYGDPGTGAGYSVQLQDGTEGVGRVLVSQTSDGKANWNIFSGINITITSAATNTLVFSAGTGGAGGGVTSITAGYGVSANTSTGNVTIIQVFDYGKAYTTGNNLNFL